MTSLNLVMQNILELFWLLLVISTIVLRWLSFNVSAYFLKRKKIERHTPGVILSCEMNGIYLINRVLEDSIRVRNR